MTEFMAPLPVEVFVRSRWNWIPEITQCKKVITFFPFQFRSFYRSTNLCTGNMSVTHKRRQEWVLRDEVRRRKRTVNKLCH